MDLGTLVTEELPERMWGKAFLRQMGFTAPNSFDVRRWSFPALGATISGSNAYYTLFNHGGPHVDAPSHFGLGGGVDSYEIQSFFGPLKVFDVTGYPEGRSVPTDIFRGAVAPGDIVLVFTGYMQPRDPDELPRVRTITREAAEFLATLGIRAYGTDSFSIDSTSDMRLPSIHHSFLSRSIAVYEQLLNLEQLLKAEEMWFIGVPLNIQGGDGMLVRPVVFVY